MPSPPDQGTAAIGAAPVLTGDEAMALLQRSDANWQAGNLAEARAGFETLVAADALVDWAFFFLGRIHQRELDADAAMAAFAKAIERNGTMFWAHYERLALSQAAGAPVDQLADLVDAMMAIGWEALEGGHVRQLESVADALLEGSDPLASSRLLDRLWPSPDLSQRALLRIVASGQDAEIAAQAAARLQASEDAAAAAFAAATKGRGAPFRAHYDRLIVARESGMTIDRIATFVDELLKVSIRGITPEQVRHVEPIAHALWDNGDRDRAAALLGRLWPSPELGQFALIRIVEAGQDLAIVAQAAARLEGTPGLDDTAARILTEYHDRKGSPDRDIAALEKKRSAAPQDFQAWLSLVRSYAKKGDRDRAMAVLDQGKDFAIRPRTFVRLIANVELGDANAAFYCFRDIARLHNEVPKFPGIRLCYLLGDAMDVLRRNEVLGILLAHYAEDPDVALVEVNAAIRDQRWADAKALFDASFGTVVDKPQSVRLAQIDILAFSGELEGAHRLLEVERASGSFPPAFLRSSLRVLGELERWDALFDLGIDHLEHELSFEHFLSVMVRAGRKTGRSIELFDALLALPQLKRSQLDTLIAVMEDLAETGHSDILDRIGGIEIPNEREHRILLKLRASGEPTAPVKDLCIYYCADRTYLTPALVSLTALAMSNVSVTRRAVFHLIVDSDVVPLAKEAGGAIARRLGLSLEVVDAATIVSSADRLRTGYGLFTGGQQLALAAYYRIFFARHLVGDRRFSQALYVDADTVVRSGLEELFAMAPTAPMMARYETDRPEVRHATRIHGLQGRYFNSGVLHFDLAHPDLPALLDRAIAAAIDPDVELIFQDQCALNIAFDLRMSELPERFNYFNPPTVSGDAVAATDAVIVHYLDRPKPWDSLYRRRAREWFEWFDLVDTLRRENAPPAV